MVLVFVMPIGLENIGWKMYMINGSWDIITFILIVSYTFTPHVDETNMLGCLLGRDERQNSGRD